MQLSIALVDLSKTGSKLVRMSDVNQPTSQPVYDDYDLESIDRFQGEGNTAPDLDYVKKQGFGHDSN